MIFRTMRRFFVIPLVFVTVSGTVSAVRADDAAQRTFAFCDKNKDGKVDAGELDAIPVSMRDWLRANGPKAKSGIPRADFLRLYPTMMADLRKQTPVASGAGDVASRPVDPTPDPVPAKGQPKEAVKPVLYATTPPPDDLMETVRPSNLPASYQEADLDKDGQIDYFEWRKAKLGDFAKFQELDLNNDSVLSAQELSAGGAPVGGGSSSSTTARSDRGSTSDSNSASPRVSAVPSAPSGPSAEYITQVKYYFEVMDKQKGNGNGKLDPLEWNASKRIKPAFEKAGVDITKPMDEKTFILHYSKVFPEVKKTAPGPPAYGPPTTTRGNPGKKSTRTRRRR